MSEPDEPREPDEAGQTDEPATDPADALADMAAAQADEVEPQEDLDVPSDPLVALDQMASGPVDAAADLNQLGRFDEPAEDGAEQAYDAVEPATGVSAADAFQARRARAATIGRHQSQANTHAYKKAVIPFLLVMAALLLVVGISAVGMAAGANPQTRASRWYFWLTCVMVASFPLAAAMGFGAWWFHREVKGK